MVSDGRSREEVIGHCNLGREGYVPANNALPAFIICNHLSHVVRTWVVHSVQGMKTLRLIQVTQDDIEKGEPGDRENCMIARALKRRMPRSFPRVIKGWFATIEVCAKTYRPSKEIKERITAFDRRDKVSPFTICFDPKLKTATLGPDLLFIPLWRLLKAKRPLGR